MEQKLTKLIHKTFGSKRIISFLYFGTRAFVGANGDSDYDFMLILDKYNSSDIFNLRKICQSNQFKSLDLNVNFLYFADIKVRGKESFQLRSLRSDFYKYMENAIVLSGKNIFSRNPIKLSRNKVKDLMDFKIQEHYGRCDKLFLQKLDDKSLYRQIRKYIKGIIRFILIRESVMTFGDIIKYNFEEIFCLAGKNKIFDRSTLTKLPILLKDYSNKKSLKDLDSLRRSVYEKYLNLYSKK